jgi:nicotinamide riboside kinase
MVMSLVAHGYLMGRIARGQIAMEEDLAPLADRVLICDTDPLATAVWQRRYLDARSSAVAELARSRHDDLTLVTGPDFPFVQDGTREEGPTGRRCTTGSSRSCTRGGAGPSS